MSDRKHWFGPPAAAYAALIPLIVAAAKECGYACGVHGSMGFDLDLILVPWTETATDIDTVLTAIVKAIALEPPHVPNGPGQKPHGRVAYTLPIGIGIYLDLSFTPRTES